MDQSTFLVASRDIFSRTAGAVTDIASTQPITLLPYFSHYACTRAHDLIFAPVHLLIAAAAALP